MRNFYQEYHHDRHFIISKSRILFQWLKILYNACCKGKVQYWILLLIFMRQLAVQQDGLVIPAPTIITTTSPETVRNYTIHNAGGGSGGSGTTRNDKMNILFENEEEDVQDSRTTTTTNIWPDPNLLQRIAIDNTIILTSTNCGYISMTQNWILHLRQLNITNYVIIAQDDIVYPVLHKYAPGHIIPLQQEQEQQDQHQRAPSETMLETSPGSDVIETAEATTTKAAKVESSTLSSSSSNRVSPEGLHQPPPPLPLKTQPHTFGSRGFYDVCKVRPYMIQSILKQGYQVLYSDTDMIWLRNPLPRLVEKSLGGQGSSNNNNRNHDSDVYGDKKQQPLRIIDYIGITDTSSKYKSIERNQICTALLYLQPTTSVHLLLEYWMKLMINDIRLEGHDQDHWRTTLHDLNGNYSMKVMNKYEFPPGFLYFNVKQEQHFKSSLDMNRVYAVHANWITGYHQKIFHLQQKGHWLLKNSSTSSNSNLDTSTTTSTTIDDVGQDEYDKLVCG